MLETEVLDAPAVAEEAAAPTTDAPEAPEIASAAAEAEPTDAPISDRPRDTQGRFLKRDGSPVASDEQASLEAKASSLATTAPASPAAVPTGEPFVFRADGQKIPIPGASLTADGALAIPPDQVPVIRQLLAEGMAHRGSWRQKEADYQRQVSEAGAVEKANAEKYNGAALWLFDKLNDDNFLMALATDPSRERAYLRRELGLMLSEAAAKAPRPSAQPQTQQAEPDEAAVEQAFTSALTEELDDLMDDPQVKALFAAEDRTEIQQAFRDNMAAFAAMHEGELKLDLHKLKKAFDREVGLHRKAKQAQVDAQKATAFNDARKPTNTPIAPALSTRGPGATGPTTKKFATREEYNKHMGLS